MSNQWPRYLKWRDGRPRWEPGPKLRHAGFNGRDLKDAHGQWLSKGAAVEAADAINAEVDEWVATGEKRLREPVPKTHPRSLQALYDRFTGGDGPDADSKASPKWQRLSDSSKIDYRNKLRLFLSYKIDDDKKFGDVAVHALQPHHLYNLWEEMHGERGHSMANGTIRVVSSMLSHMRRIGWRNDNPARNIGMDGVAPRVVVWSPSEIAHLVKTADELGHHSVADAVVLALHTVQRRGDVLALEMPAIAGERSVFRQSKTKARVSVPYTPPLAERITAIRQRRRQGKVIELEAPGQLVILDEKGRAYEGDAGGERFGVAFREVRAAAAAAKDDAGALMFPDIAGKQFMDLRDTGITRLALAGCTVPEIRAISGHTMTTIHEVLKHYLALDDRMADAAIGKLKVWMAEEGIAI
ncbi:MAG TPA: hypothetical protein PK857_00380 [Hyphomicrobium sp.]|nr:hypothetical protein [Hyphomicrobium sp.]HRO48804.1 hypothetical protein [Hyphomicrobium sp.]